MDKRNEQISEGIRKGFAEENSKLANRICYGYEQDDHGDLVINEKKANIVQSIFQLYISGYSLGKIAESLFEKGIKSPTGRPKWNREAIDKLLSNEKYIGDVLLQKTLVSNGRQVDNKNTLKQYITHDNHPSIISQELFEEVQAEKQHRSNIIRNQTGSERKVTRYNSGYVLSGLIICSECGGVYRRITRNIKGCREILWRCSSRVEHGGKLCKGSPTITDQEIKVFLRRKLKVKELNDEVIRKKLKFIIVDSVRGLAIKYKSPDKSFSL
jgi:hypothetical protein